MKSRPLDRATTFCVQYGLKVPVMLAPMAGACPASLSIAVANASAAAGDYHRMQVWAGQSAAMAKPIPPVDLVKQIWDDARDMF